MLYPCPESPLCVCVCVLTFYFILQLINNAVLFQVHSKVLQTVPLCVQTALCCEAWSGFLELSPVPWLLIGCNDSQPWLNIRITCEVVNKQTTTTKPLRSVKSESLQWGPQYQYFYKAPNVHEKGSLSVALSQSASFGLLAYPIKPLLSPFSPDKMLIRVCF